MSIISQTRPLYPLEGLTETDSAATVTVVFPTESFKDLVDEHLDQGGHWCLGRDSYVWYETEFLVELFMFLPEQDWVDHEESAEVGRRTCERSGAKMGVDMPSTIRCLYGVASLRPTVESYHSRVV